MAHPKLEQVRQRYDCCCGYCGVSEVDAGGTLTVDHYRPVTRDGDNTDDNLVYACIHCNQYKGRFYPSPQDVACGRRVLHPLRDDLGANFAENPHTGLIEPLNETGRFHIALLQLNRPALVQHRLRRRLHLLYVLRKENLEIENEQARALVEAQRDYISHLRELLGLPSPEDH